MACLARFRASIEAQGEDGKKAGRKPRRFIAPGLSLLPAVRAVSEDVV